MTFLDLEGVVGTLTPNVFISRITLSSFGTAENETDPHIDHEREPHFIKDPRTGKVVLEKIIPNFSNSSSKNSLNISIDLTLKEMIDKSIIAQWAGENNFSKYIKVRVVQLTKPFPLQTLQTMHRLDVEEPTIQTQDFSIEDLKRFDEEVLSNGTKLKNFSFSANFHLRSVEPDFLSYLAFSYLDLEKIINDFGIKSDLINFVNPFGKAVAETVFIDKNVVQKSFVFLTEAGDVWVGPISQVQNDFFGLRNGQEIKLVRQEVPNTKIQDFRVFDTFKEINFDLNIENQILNKIDTIKNDPFGKRISNSSFSDLLMARDHLNQNRFLFAINLQEIFKTHSIFGNLFQNETNEILEKSRICSLKIYRRRIQGSPELKTGADPSKTFFEEQFDELFISTGEETFQKIKVVNDNRSAFEEVGPIFVAGQDLSKIRFFSGIDKEISNATDGYFIYRLDLVIEDPAVEFVREKLEELRTIRKDLEQFYVEGSFGGKIQVGLNLTDPHLDHPRETIVKGNIVEANFDPISNRFSQKFVDEMREKNNGRQWLDAPSKFISIVKLFSNEVDWQEIERQLLVFIHPTTGTLSGIHKFLEIIISFEKKLAEAIGQTHLSSRMGEQKGLSSSKSSAVFSNSNLRFIRLSQVFSSILNSSLEKGVGFDFLDVDANIGNGVKKISGEDYSKRVERETDKFFVRNNGINPNINLVFRDEVFTENDHLNNTNWSYLSPAKINLKDVSIVRLGHSPQPSFSPGEASKANLGLKMIDSDKNSFNKLRSSKNFLAKSSNAMLSKLGVSLKKLTHRNIDTKVVFSQERQPTIIDRIVDPIPECEVEVSNDGSLPLFLELLNGSEIDLRAFNLQSSKSVFRKLTTGQNAVSAERFFQGMSHSTTLNETLKSLPNQIKSLFIGQLNPNAIRKEWLRNKNVPSSEQADFHFDFELLQVVQVFKGFVRDVDGNILVKQMLWEPLTLEKFNSSIGAALICRLKPYENKMLNLPNQKEQHLFYDTIFLLIPKQLVPVGTRVIPKIEVKFKTKNLNPSFSPDRIVLENIKTDYLTTDFLPDPKLGKDKK